MDNIEKVTYLDKYKQKWDDFVKNSRNGTFLNTKKFLNYHPPDKFNDDSLLFFKKRILIAIIPAVIKTENNKKIFFSHPGSTYGGIIIGKNTKLKDLDEIVKKIILHCKKTNVDKIIIKTPPKIYYKYPSDEVDFSLYHNKFEIKKRDLSTCIRLDKFNKSFIRKSNILAINRGKKRGDRVEESNDFENFWKILRENLKIHNAIPTHELEEIKLLKSLFPEDIKLFVLKKEDQIIAGSLVFIKNNQAIHTQYLSVDYNFKKLRPLYTIIDYLINYGKENGFLYLNFGVSTEGFGDYINWGLFDFKESFGGRGVIRDMWERIIN